MLFKAHQITKTYQSTLSIFGSRKVKSILGGISMALNEGEIVGLVGESGCGKSTLARVLTGLEKPTSGEIYLDGAPISKMNSKELKAFHKTCQIIFQDTLSSLNPTLKIESILMEPLKNYYSFSKREGREKICSMMEKVYLSPSCLERYPSELSGGERQRVNILRALLLKPKLLICDEVVSSLDVTTQKSIMDLLLYLNKHEKMAILFISHDLKVTKYLSDRILVMEDGLIVETLTRGESSFLHPCTRRLFKAQLITHPNDRWIHQGKIIT